MKLDIVLCFYLFILLLNVYHIICNNILYEDIYLRNMSGKKVLYFQSILYDSRLNIEPFFANFLVFEEMCCQQGSWDNEWTMQHTDAWQKKTKESLWPTMEFGGISLP